MQELKVKKDKKKKTEERNEKENTRPRQVDEEI